MGEKQDSPWTGSRADHYNALLFIYTSSASTQYDTD